MQGVEIYFTGCVTFSNFLFSPEFDRVMKGDLKGAELQKVLEEYNKQVVV